MSITKFRIPLKDSNRWEFQNQAEYTDYFVEGVLTDNYVLKCKRGWCFVYEATDGWYPNTPIYKFAAYKDDAAVAALWDEWFEFEESARLAERLYRVDEQIAA